MIRNVSSGIIPLIKPPGISSNSAVGQIRRMVGVSKAGHTGTLDPAASGVLPVLIGRATRLSDILLSEDKTYVFEITFGLETDTLDAEGKVIKRADSKFSEEDLAQALSFFTGKYSQMPPVYSAIKISGQKSYDLARKGIISDISPRNVTISRLDIICRTGPDSYILRVGCSKGTYIRSLAKDIADRLGTCAYISLLIREKSGAFDINDSFTIEEISEMIDKGDQSFIRTPESYLNDFPAVTLNQNRKKALENGLETTVRITDGVYRVYCGDTFYGLGKSSNNLLKLYIPLY